ncbi:ragulator complex protein LAMTOR3 [Patella vulgata]|uniref:ragulator complex protein LAMTOR3 n=1 Tax=Patella vulgata TaxID=6465 RepID=UPI00218053C2|nr:ragulator complex protein LAMTOR3 [Patella vulgata]
MMEDLKRYMMKVMANVDGLYAIVVTDRDGVVMLKVANESVPDQATRPPFLSVFGAMSDQASKLGLGTNKSILSLYENFQVVQINKSPLLVTMIATSEANTGDILKLEKEFEEIFIDLTKVIQMT